MQNLAQGAGVLADSGIEAKRVSARAGRRSRERRGDAPHQRMTFDVHAEVGRPVDIRVGGAVDARALAGLDARPLERVLDHGKAEMRRHRLRIPIALFVVGEAAQIDGKAERESGARLHDVHTDAGPPDPQPHAPCVQRRGARIGCGDHVPLSRLEQREIGQRRARARASAVPAIAPVPM
jgi:hypothetical protein